MSVYIREVTKNMEKLGQIIVKGLSVNVRILDLKTAYNKKRYLVTPSSGNGEIWVDTVYSIHEEARK